MIEKVFPYVIAFLGPLILTLLLTPVVREINRRLGMVDRPDERRLNKVPIPRGGGLAIILGMAIGYGLFLYFTDRPGLQGLAEGTFFKMSALSFAIALLGLADDRFSLPPKLKLLGQVAVAFLVWRWADLGFADLWPWLPVWLDCALTMFWVVGAVNAFNLIDGLDGLACGIALIATIGMAGSCFFVQNPQASLFYFAFAGALLGFLRYNYNPASVFLGDCGSMFIGFVIATLPLASHVPNSFLVSVGVPLLAMGVPIFDTSLAILRRTLRRLIARGKTASGGQVMTADADHLHHRILRATGLNQRKTAWILYGISAAAVLTGLVAMFLKSRTAGLWLATMAIGAVVIFKDATIELFDAGRLLNEVAHTRDRASRRRMAVWSVPFFVIFDIIALAAVFFLCARMLRFEMSMHLLRAYLPVRVVAVFMFLVFFRTYRTIWSRALLSNYIRLLLACVFGSVAGSVFLYYWPSTATEHINVFTLLYAMVSFVALLTLRVFRGMVRDIFYAIDCSRLRERKDVSRILVYGCGLRYRSFRRELVRTTAANDRMIVGLIDDDVYLKGKYIGGIRILGTINEAPEIVNATNADAVVIACDISDTWLAVVKKLLEPTGVKVTRFAFSEKPV